MPTPEVYARYKAEGRCIQCGQTGKGSPNCDDCRAKRNDKFRKEVSCKDCGMLIPPIPGKRLPKRCADCKAAKNRERYRSMSPERKEARRLQLTEYGRKWRDTNRKRRLDNDLRRKYGIGLEQYAAVLEAQQGKCAICLRPLAPIDAPGHERRTTCADHCHGSGLLRGILCNHCNLAIGLLGDSPANLRRAAAYLEGCPLALVSPPNGK